MGYTNHQIGLMVNEYLSRISSQSLGDRAEPKEVEQAVHECHFAAIEHYTSCGRLPPVDVLFLLMGEAKHFEAFTIENGVLVPLHQEHRAEFCSTCSEQSPSAASHEPF